MATSQPLSIALSDCLAFQRLSAPLAEHRLRQPEVAVHLRERPLPALHQGLLDGEFDAGLCQSAKAPKGIDVVPLWQDTLVLALSRNHPLLALGMVPLAQAAKFPWITLDRQSCAGYDEQVAPLLEKSGVRSSNTTTVQSVELMMTLVAAGYGVCLVPLETVERYRGLGIIGRPVSEDLPALTTYLLRRTSHNDNKYLERLTESLQVSVTTN